MRSLELMTFYIGTPKRQSTTLISFIPSVVGGSAFLPLNLTRRVVSGIQIYGNIHKCGIGIAHFCLDPCSPVSYAALKEGKLFRYSCQNLVLLCDCELYIPIPYTISPRKSYVLPTAVEKSRYRSTVQPVPCLLFDDM